ncbi:MAG: tetratricopeptide repeat protein [Rickettsiales bacterium]|nr:tetratricopeptide repeat protein [Rickettsiales bacterium]
MIEFLAKFLVKNSFKITLLLVLTPLIWQFKPIIYSSIIGLYNTVPSFNKTYDTLISLRSPFHKTKKISPSQEFIDELIPEEIYNKYPVEIVQNLKTALNELVTIEKQSNSHVIKQTVNNSLQAVKIANFSLAKDILLKKFQNTDNKKKKSEYMVYVGNLEVFEDPNFAISYYEKAFNLNNKNLSAINNIGHIFRLMGNFSEALRFYTQLISFSESNGQWNHAANAISNIGVVYQQMNELTLAKKYYHEALEINNKLSNDLRAATQYFNLGTIYEELSQHEKACDNYRKARIIFYRNYRQPLVDSLDQKLQSIGCH